MKRSFAAITPEAAKDLSAVAMALRLSILPTPTQKPSSPSCAPNSTDKQIMHPYNPTPIQRERLVTLIAHLRKMPTKRFDFQRVYLKTSLCGAVGCAVGQALYLWPDLITINPEPKWGAEVLQYCGVNMMYWRIAHQLFGIEPSDGEDIFTPDSQPSELPQCQDDASPVEVADMLQAYLDFHTK